MKLAAKFVPAADEVYRLQNGADPECRLFQKIAKQGHYGGRPGQSQQGTYAAAPSGVMLASLNSNDAGQITRMLERALAKWEKMSREERLLPKDPDAEAADVKRAERFYPKDGLVLHVATRDLPRDTAPPPGWRGQAWNQDFAWFTKKEARQLLPARPEIGQKQDLPTPVLHRIVCAHLVDNVRGQTIPYAEGDVVKARLTAEVMAVKDDIVTLRLEGESKAEARRSEKRGFEVKLLGKATYDLKKERFVAFELVAVGTRHGATQFNVRRGDLGPAPIGAVFTLAGDSAAERVAPAFHYDRVYRPVVGGKN